MLFYHLQAFPPPIPPPQSTACNTDAVTSILTFPLGSQTQSPPGYLPISLTGLLYHFFFYSFPFTKKTFFKIMFSGHFSFLCPVLLDNLTCFHGFIYYSKRVTSKPPSPSQPWLSLSVHFKLPSKHFRLNMPPQTYDIPNVISSLTYFFSGILIFVENIVKNPSQ